MVAAVLEFDPKVSRSYKKMSSREEFNKEAGEQLISAVRQKSVENVEKILETYERIVFYSDQNRNTAVHWALVKSCFCEECQRDGEKCLELLFQYGADPNVENNAGETPMHFVARNMVPIGMVDVLVRYGGSICGSDGIKYPELAKKLVLKYPEVLEATFDNGIKFSKGGAFDQVSLNWRYLTYSQVLYEAKEAKKRYGYIPNTQRWQETKFLYDIVCKGNTSAKRQLLGHPLVHAFLQFKAPMYLKYFGMFYMFFFILGFTLYFAFIWLLYFKYCKYSEVGDSENQVQNCIVNTTSFIYEGSPKQYCKFQGREWSTLVGMAYTVLAVITIGPAALELRKVTNFGVKEYLKMWQTWVSVGSIGLVISTLWPVLILEKCMSLSWEYPWASVSVLVSSVTFLIQLNPIPVVAIHLEMLYKVCRQILLATLCLMPLYIGFFASFRILMTNETVGFFKLLTMIVSDADYESMLDQNRGSLYEIIAYSLFTVFIVIMIIVVLNFLIGIAVSDIQELKEAAETTNLSNLVSSLYLMDCVLGQSGRHTLTQTKREKMLGDSYEYRIDPLSEEEDSVDLIHSGLSKTLQLSLLDIARRGCFKRAPAQPTRQGNLSFKRTSIL